VDGNFLDYDEKISFYWPEFGKNGKENITLSDVLKHQAGLCYIDDRDPNTLDEIPLFDPDPEYLDKIQLLFENSFSSFPEEDTRTAYHGVTRGLILNCLVRKVDPKHRTIGQFVADEIAKPLGVNYFIGLANSPIPQQELDIVPHQPDSWAWRIRIVAGIVFRHILGNRLGLIEPLPKVPHDFSRALKDVKKYGVFGSPLLRTAETIKGVWALTFAELHNLAHARYIESPSSNGIGNARAMAAIMNSALHGFISNETYSRLLEYTSPAYDISIHASVAYTTGGWAFFHDDFGAFESFYGWHGLGGALLLVDPHDELVVAFATTRIGTRSPWEDERTLALLTAIRKCVSKLEE